MVQVPNGDAQEKVKLDNEVTSYRVIKTWIPTVLLDNEINLHGIDFFTSLT